MKIDQTKPNAPIFTVTFDGIDNTVNVVRDRIGYRPNLKRERGLSGHSMARQYTNPRKKPKLTNHNNDYLSSDNEADARTKISNKKWRV